MALMEIRSDLLNKKNPDEKPRLFHDSFRDFFLHVWLKGEGPEAERFQISWKNDAIEYRNGHISTGCFDEGSRGLGVKRSPVMRFEERVDEAMVRRILPVLSESTNETVGWVAAVLKKATNHEN